MDKYTRSPLAAILGAGLVAALSVGVLSGALVLAVSTWPEASTGGRAALAVAVAVALAFALTCGLYTLYDVRETASRVAYGRYRRNLLLEELEARLGWDIDGDGVIGAPSLPRVLPVSGRVVGYDEGLPGEEALLSQVDALLQDAERSGSISRSTLEAKHGREFYDWLLSTSPAQPGLLVSLGLVAGRGRRSSGRLVCSAEDASRRVREAFGVASASVNEDGNGRG